MRFRLPYLKYPNCMSLCRKDQRADGSAHTAFCLLPSAFCLLPSAYLAACVLVAAALDGLYEVGPVAFLAQFVPQPVHVRLELVAAPFVVATPGLGDEPFMGDHVTGVAHEHV